MTGREKLTAWRDEMERKGKTWRVMDYHAHYSTKLTPASVEAEVLVVLDSGDRGDPKGDRVVDRSLQLARKAGAIRFDRTERRWRWA